VTREGVWLGAAGVAAPLDQAMAASLAGITRSDLVFLGKGGSLITSGMDVGGRALAERVAGWPRDGVVRELDHGDRRYLVVTATLDDAMVVFVRDLQRELAVLPKLRRVAAASGAGALGISLLLGAILAGRLSRPVRQLADASDRVAAGDFGAPLPTSPVQEIARVSSAFEVMRVSLEGRLHELSERQARLTALQSELIQRERTAVSVRLLGELAHEIRNPVANLRNCLELLHRRLATDPEGQEYASLAIDELLRMHELAERMLDLNRPRDPALNHCDVLDVLHGTTSLILAGRKEGELDVRVAGEAGMEADIPPDTLKQVLLNLVQNAREAKPLGLEMWIGVWREGDRIVLEVVDNGPGVAAEVRERLFQPFVTTKGPSGGVGLGLFLMDGTLRRYGGRLVLCGPEHPAPHPIHLGGACFRIELPARSDPEVPARIESTHAAGRAAGTPLHEVPR
jgi:signal transduction histidine kinase